MEVIMHWLIRQSGINKYFRISHIGSPCIAMGRSHILFITGWLMTTGLFLLPVLSLAQTSWTGVASTAWSNNANWTAGVPNATVDVVIGNASFTGAFSPTISASASCKSLTVGAGVNATLTVSKNLTVSGNLLIAAGSTISQKGSTLTVNGNWTNNGSYTPTANNARVTFAGVTQSIGGTTATAFRSLTIGVGGTTTQNTNMTVAGTLTVNGTFIPADVATPVTTSGNGNITVSAGGILQVNASTFAGNYASTGTITLAAGSIVNYGSTLVNQTVKNNLTYSTLRISGSGIKTLGGNLNPLNSTTATAGTIEVLAGTLDLSTFTASRGTTVAGGGISVANATSLKIGGTGTFPANYGTVSLGLTSTVEYNGTTQTVAAQTYGNLTLSSGSSASVKTMPSTAFTVAGNLTSAIGSGTAVSYTAASNITVSGNVNIGTGTTFSGGSFTVTTGGDWVNNGTFSGGTSTVVMTGGGTSISGSGTHNFNNLTVAATNITAAASTSLNLSGNFASTAPGTFTHQTGGTVTMSGTGASITGTGFSFENLAISGTVTAAVDIILTGNISASGTFTNTSGSVTMSGTGKTISGAGTLNFGSLIPTGTITSTANFSVNNTLNVSGSFSASAGTATFTGTSVLNGTANLFNVTLNGTSLLLSANSTLGIANTYTVTAGTLNVTSSVPNTVNFNSTAAQTIPAGTFNNLTVSGGNTKTLGGTVTANGDFTIASGTTFSGSSQSISISGNWINNGTFTASTSTVTLTGGTNTSITGASTFSTLVINKSTAATQVTLVNNISVATLTMTSGTMNTGANTVTITGDRSGNGIILGTIQHAHAFALGTTYAFEGPNTTITLNALGVTSVTMSVLSQPVADFPSGAAINREYDITVGGALALAATTTLRFHYEDADLNGNTESGLTIWSNTGSGWSVYGNSVSSTTSNYVEQSKLLTSFAGRYTLSSTANVVRWNGSVSTDWNTAGNWTVAQGSPSRPPGVNDIAEIGTIAFTNQPTISASANVKSISFGGVQAATLTLASGGSLTTQGNIGGVWSGNAAHTINVGAQTMTVNGNLVLSDGTAGHTVQLNVGNGSVTVGGSVTQSGGAGIACSGTGSLSIGGNFNYTSGTFTAGSGTVIYNGAALQSVAGLTYNHLTINKSANSAQINSSTTVNGNLTVSSGDLSVNAATTVTGDITLGTGATANGGGAAISLNGNWNNSGTFTPSTGTINFTGSNAQNISSTTFNNLVVNKTGGTASLTGNIVMNGNLSVNAGTLGLATFTANRATQGGILTVANSSLLTVGGTANFPANYSQYQLGNTSTVNYNAAGAQTVSGNISYGFLTLSGSGTKTQAANFTVNNDLTIGSGVTYSAGAFTTNLYGNWSNSGTFSGGTGTVTLNGSSKTITGNTTFNRLTVYGSYAVAGSDITYNGLLQIVTGGSYDGGSGSATVNGDLINSGSLISNGVTTFSGTSLQTIRFINALVSNSTGVINFNGNVSPVLNSTSSPTFATLNVNNTAGINPSVGWLVLVAFNISSGAVFNGGLPTHTIQGSFTNNGTVTSSGTLNFNPSSPQNIQLTGTSFSSTGTVIFGGTAAITVNGTPNSLNIVNITNTAGVSPTANWSLNADLHIAGNAIFNAGSNTFTTNGNIESNGTLNGGTSTFTMTAPSGTLTGSLGTTFYNLVINGTIQTESNFNIQNNFTINGALDASIGMPNMTGSGPSVIGGTASPFNLAQLGVQKSATATVTQARTLSLMSTLSIVSGTLDTGDSTIIQDPAGGGVLTINDSARLIVRGVYSLPAFDNYALDTLSTVEYGGSTQTVSAVTPYGNLTISTAGTKTATAALTIQNDFTLSNGTFVPGSFTDTLRRHWTMTSGTFTNTGSTIYFSGSVDQNVSSTGAFNHITINKTAGAVVLSSNITANGNLTFTAKGIRTGSNTMIIASTGSVIGGGQSTGWVYGLLQKNIATGTNINRLYEVGDSLNYTPATLLFASVGTSGNVTALVTPESHPNLATSGLNTSKKVNRYWSVTNNGTVFTTATATLNWTAADVDAGANTANFKVARYSGGSWTQPSVTAPLATSIQTTGLTAFGDLAVGELSIGAVWTGAVSTSWYVTGNWSPAAIPVSVTNVTIPTGLVNYPLINTGTAITNNITIQSGASVTVNGGILQIGGVIANSGTFTATSGTIVLNGLSAQAIPASTFSSNTIQHLTVNNIAGVTLGGVLNLSGILRITAGQLTTGGFLTLLSTASQTALIDGSGAGQVSGNVTMRRYLPTGFGYRYFSAPFQASTVNEFANDINLNATFPSFYQYVENRASTGWVAYTTTTNILTPMVGYAAQMGTSTSPVTVDMTGTVNNGTVTAPTVTNNNQPYTQGFNLVGNPYPSPIDWDAAIGWTRTNVDNAVYYFNTGATDQYTGTYSSYINGVSSDGIAGNIIASMQGFFIHVTSGTFPVSGTLSVNNNVRTTNLSPVFHRVPQTMPLLRLGAAFADDGLSVDPLVVYFDAAATPSFEKDMDALKLMNTDPTVPNMYTLSADNQRLSINAWPANPDSNTVIPIGLKMEKTGWITFNTIELLRIPDGLHIYLKDETVGKTVELLQDAKYRVYLEAGSYDRRFSLVFRKGGEVVSPASEPVFRAYFNGKTLYGYFDKVTGEKCHITISNLLGQVVWSKEVVGNGQQHVIGKQYSSGIYIVSFHANDKVVSRKVFIVNQ
ncbi:hypothetical protein FHW36_1011632 [Chitinophaga polysaccharea]|uniref:Uncharacterized protein n=1 Tax=Chitinophaga polysaccharea TaxID=1293035 RepID=A0A561Q5R1_9BACT|nr:T9SS type A sorting domain-containing protein [Chitinophaga polysaccharea]TWF45701.1 hypothetical protein FHW36_1011632 [Chitinophaga polysaccharea]